jgi:HD-GYP domain-containing protein (c-di-GMP phosphodiesterase class II)
MLEVIKIDTTELKLGMYVSGLDRPWLETPFPMQGFRIESPEEVERLRKFCQYVFVDTQKSVVAAPHPRRSTFDRPRKSKEQIFKGSTLKRYQDSTSWSEEYPRAQQAVEALSAAIDAVFVNVAAGGALDVVKVKKSVDPMIESITRNPDACIWLARMKQQDNYTFQHSVGASIWAVALGRQLGLPKADLRSLAVGGLLFDIGKLRVNEELLKTERILTEEEFSAVRAHVAHGVALIAETGLMNQDVIDMVSHHHERHNGSGYPDGLRGDNIPIYARIAAIVDCYDAITSHRSYARAIPPSAAIKMLYEWRNVDFQGELVEEFIQAVGIYPAGTLVELSSGEVAVVIAEYRTRRLRPQVLVLLDADKQPVMEVKMIDMLSQTTVEDGSPLEIIGSLEPEAYGIDMTAIQL